MKQRLLNSVYSWVALVAIIITIITANSFYVVHTLDELAALEARLFTTNRVINALNELHVAILKTESGQRGYLITQDERYLDEYTNTLNILNDLMDEVEASSGLSEFPEQVARINNLIQLSRAKFNELIETVELARDGERREAMKIFHTDQGLVLYDEFESLFKAIDKSERQIQNRHLTSLMKLRRDSINTLLISGFTTALLIISIFILVKMNIREAMRHQRTLELANEELEEKIEQRTVELKIYADELARSNRELEDFAFVASHDLQEPLRKIRAFGNRIDSGYSDVIDERGKDFLKRMLNAAERMSMLISDLLAFSRVTTRGKEFTEVDLNGVIKHVLDDLEIVIEESNATVEVDSLPSLMADESQMDQLFLNLISNALKFRHPDIPPVVKVKCETPPENEIDTLLHVEEHTFVKITVQDNGIGFEQSFAEKIFAPFQRLHGRSEYKGTGIGLAVCRRIVERHNGQIKAYSEPGVGSRFVIIVPLDSEPFTSSTIEGVVENVS